MVFPGGISLLSENENAPLSPEQVEHAKFKSSQLDSELGLDTYHDPSGDENGKESEQQLFSDLNLGKSVEKIACVIPSFDFSANSIPYEADQILGKMELIKNIKDQVSKYFSVAELTAIAEKNEALSGTYGDVLASAPVEEDMSLETYIDYLSSPEGEETTPMAVDSSTESEINQYRIRHN